MSPPLHRDAVSHALPCCCSLLLKSATLLLCQHTVAIAFVSVLMLLASLSLPLIVWFILAHPAMPLPIHDNRQLWVVILCFCLFPLQWQVNRWTNTDVVARWATTTDPAPLPLFHDTVIEPALPCWCAFVSLLPFPLATSSSILRFFLTKYLKYFVSGYPTCSFKKVHTLYIILVCFTIHQYVLPYTSMFYRTSKIL